MSECTLKHYWVQLVPTNSLSKGQQARDVIGQQACFGKQSPIH